MKTIQVKNTLWKAPLKWDELTRQQLLWFADCVIRKLSIKEASKYVATRILGVRQLKFPDNLRLQLRWHVEDCIEFLFHENTLSNNLISDFRIGLRKYYGPDDKLKNLLGDEFAEADRHFGSYMKTKSEEDLNSFIACLYRPTNPFIRIARLIDGRDLRKNFNSKIVSRRAKRFSRLSPVLKQAIVINYRGMRALMESKFPLVFTKSNQEKSSTKGGWPRIFLNMAGSKLGTDDQVQKKRIWNILFIAQVNEEDRLKREEKK